MRNNDKTKARAEEREKNIGWIKRLFSAWRVSHAERGLDAEAELQGRMSAHIAGLDSHAPTELVAAADATWNGDLDLYGMLLTCFGAAVMHSVKKIGLVVDSSHESEAIASAKAGELVAYAREVLVAPRRPDRPSSSRTTRQTSSSPTTPNPPRARATSCAATTRCSAAWPTASAASSRSPTTSCPPIS